MCWALYTYSLPLSSPEGKVGGSILEMKEGNSERPVTYTWLLKYQQDPVTGGLLPLAFSTH